MGRQGERQRLKRDRGSAGIPSAVEMAEVDQCLNVLQEHLVSGGMWDGFMEKRTSINWIDLPRYTTADTKEAELTSLQKDVRELRQQIITSVAKIS